MVSPVVVENYNNCGGTVEIIWTYSDTCGNEITETQLITVDTADAPSFVNPPADLTVTCAEADTLTFGDLDYSNAASGTCLVQGSVSPSVVANYDVCGGQIAINWVFNDSCGRSLEHSQVITVTESPVPVFISVPADTTIDCSDVSTFVPQSLSYSNGASANCEIVGTVAPSMIDNSDACGGTLAITWTYTDSCGRTIDAQQMITVNPAPPASFINIPADTMLSCADSLLADLPDLMYSNGDVNCLIEGQVSGTESGSVECGGIITRTWTFTDSCDRTITAIQSITIMDDTPPVLLGVPQDTLVDCIENLPAAPDLIWTDDCDSSGTVSPVITSDGQSNPETFYYAW
ncbi:MAG: hypothetical protein R3330_16235, partial [Saprospiraceae bacterium]|nr:hypothetical protein [Saprospiraceae bacterium]